ncbi:MAG: UDP-N-acetylmuramoyl-L-alanyl-D-glutamate--2,6-diaminopimelate ligase [Clostridia bacterium]|nr:UDP-N-acetylmuramoyl-L-alanyl-D-glutamate--2,6-diaminopimelate ligase [Clostridia bacterium]
MPDDELSGVCSDSDNLQKDSVFVAIKGNEDDGHRYINDAAKKGAKVIIAEHAIDCNVPIILTDDTRSALCYLVKNFYGEPKIDLIGVTGTNGKTSTTYMIESIMRRNGIKTGVIGTLGVKVGEEKLVTFTKTSTTPDILELYRILEAMSEKADVCAMEVSSHGLAQERVSGLWFKVGVFTNLTRDHLDYHKTMEEYYSAKKKLFTVSEKAVINADDSYGKRLLSECKNAVSYGINEGDICAFDIEKTASGSHFSVVLGGEKVDINLKIPGEFYIYNALAAIAACHIMGVSNGAIQEGISFVSEISGRMESLDIDGVNVIIDYAHTPDGLLKVLKTLRNIQSGKIICLFGCGGDRDRSKRPIMGRIATENSEITIVTSDNPRTENPNEIIIDILTGIKKDNYIVVPNREKAIYTALSMADRGDTVLLAGKGQEKYQIVGKEKFPFDEREIVRKRGK